MNIKSREELLAIFKSGIANFEFVTSESLKQNIAKSILSFIKLFFKRLLYRKLILSESDGTICMEWQPLHHSVLSLVSGKHIALLNNKRLIENEKLVSFIPQMSLLAIVIDTPHFAIKNKYLSAWLLFIMIENVVRNEYVKVIYIAGHYDNISTWIALLTEKYGKKLVISQHGVCAGLDLPCKIPVTKVLSFSNAESDMFRKFVKNPEKVQFEIKQFNSTISFAKGNFSGFSIAIVSQPGYEEVVIEIARRIIQNININNILIYPHPLDRYWGKSFVQVEKQRIRLDTTKYSDIDCLITINSTLVYDYMSLPDYKGKLICYYKPNDDTDLAVYHEPKIQLIKPEDFDDFINRMVNV